MSRQKAAGKFLQTLAGTRFPTPPVWLMRQAGRYLPEYRAVRATTKSFLEFCYTPDKAVEVTLQPIRRFGFDAAIIFSDILVVPDALGQKVWFEEGEGPKLEALTDPSQFGRLSRARIADHLAPVYEAIRQTRAALPSETALLGFAGAPFTLACYMIEGSGSKDFAKVKKWAYAHPESFGLLIDLLVEAVVDHLAYQVEAGVDAVQLFDSWAGVLPEEQLFHWSLDPMVRIAKGLRERHPDVPIIAFPRAVGPAMLMYRRPDTFSALSIDTGIGAHWAAKELQPHICLQGNLDPIMLVAGGQAMEREATRILDKLGHGSFVFNLGHGVVPQTPPDNVARLVEIVRNWKPGSHEHRAMKIAIILFNLGGPDSPEAVQPFLKNLFSDPAIISLPSLLRLPLASFISSRRAPRAKKIYDQIGGSSPILGQTEAQARALEEALASGTGSEHEWRGYVCMRYWHPMTEAVVRSVKRFAPDRIVLLPLYPQFSTATTDSSVKAWKAVAEAAKLNVPTQTVCCYPDEPGFIAASVDLVKQGLAEAGAGPVRVLFSAHGLPEKVIKRGDPYQVQVERTAAAIAGAITDQIGSLDWSVCYQSRVGPLKWIGPSTDAEIRRAGADKRAVVLYPLAFVSEHSETLVELDIDYRRLAESCGVPVYKRVPTVGTHPSFIAGLANRVRAVLSGPQVAVCHGATTMPCGQQHRGCPLIAGAV